jgi:hypothetical protein
MIRSFEMRKWGHLIKPRISLQFFASAALALIAALGVGDAFAQAPPRGIDAKFLIVGGPIRQPKMTVFVARHDCALLSCVRNVPGRKTDVADALWLTSLVAASPGVYPV